MPPRGSIEIALVGKERQKNEEKPQTQMLIYLKHSLLFSFNLSHPTRGPKEPMDDTGRQVTKSLRHAAS